MEISCIYAISSPSGKAYIGSTKNFVSRMATHKYHFKHGKHHCSALRHAFEKYGIEKLSFDVLELCPETDLISREQWWIDNYQVKYDGIYNSRKTAEWHSATEHQRELARKQMTGRTRGKQEIQRFIETTTGQKRSEQAKINMSNAQKGKKLTEMHKLNMSIKRRGMKFKSNKTGITGVSKCSRSDRWVAAICINGKQKNLGRYDTIEQAALASKNAETEFWGWHV